MKQDLWPEGFPGRAVIPRARASCRLSMELSCDIYGHDFGQQKHKPVELDAAFDSEGGLARICSRSVLQKADLRKPPEI